jgi:serine/threonine-protein kinase RsbW
MVKAICDFMMLDKNDSQNIELSVVEAVNNVIKHAYNSESGHHLDVDIFVSDDKIVFKISDTGKGMDFKNCRHKNMSFNIEPNKIETLPVGGMGLHIIHSLMDEVLYETVEDKNTITLVKFFKK